MLKEKKVSVIAPSSPPENNKWRKSFDILKSWGLQAGFPPSSLKPNFFHSHSNSKRAFFLKQAFKKRSSSAVWMLRGGYGCQKLQSVFPHIEKNSKIFIGYSDGTALHLYLNAKNKVSLHAPTLSELDRLSLKELNTLKSVLLGEKKQLCFKNLKLFNSSSLQKSKSGMRFSFDKILKGKITGGNLSLISTSVGAFKLPSTEFLFLEDVNEPAYKVDRLLHHLLYSGVLKSTKAILFGGFYPLKDKELQEVLKSFSQSYSIPFIYGLPCGHTKRMPLVFNTRAELCLKGLKANLTINTLK